MVALPEMFFTGYQTQDLIRKPVFAADAMRHIEALAQECAADGPVLAIGGPVLEDERLYNAYFYLSSGQIETSLTSISCRISTSLVRGSPFQSRATSWTFCYRQ